MTSDECTLAKQGAKEEGMIFKWTPVQDGDRDSTTHQASQSFYVFGLQAVFSSGPETHHNSICGDCTCAKKSQRKLKNNINEEVFENKNLFLTDLHTTRCK